MKNEPPDSPAWTGANAETRWSAPAPSSSSSQGTPAKGHGNGLTQTLASEPPPGGFPNQIGHYRITRVIASGGMGTVYEAVQENPRRAVAVKVMRTGLLSRSAQRRFEYEAQILARLRHPGIAQIFEADVYQQGDDAAPFFAMEYIPSAAPITRFAEEKKLDARRRLAMFAKVCEAVHHGHQKGIIHRDLKPSNILVDSSGQTKIIDFGVARSTGSDLALTTLQTGVGQLIGTLQYMSPEQCAGDPHDLDTRSDIYSLGVVLYELLAGQLPYDVTKISLLEATRVIREQNPMKLSTIQRVFRGDIETIVLKALEKDRQRRYQSAADLAQDIDRYLNQQPILARPPSTWYHLRVFARRNRAACTVLIALFFVLLASSIVTTVLYLRADAARQETVREKDRAVTAERVAAARAVQAEEVTGFLSKTLSSVRPADALGHEVTVKEMLDEAARRISTAFVKHPLAEANLRLTIGNTYRALGKYQDAEPHLLAAIDLFQKHMGPNHLDSAAAINELAALYEGQGAYPQAEKLQRQAMAIYEQTGGTDDSRVTMAQNNLGVLLWRQGKYDEAEAMLTRVLSTRRNRKEDDRSITNALNNLAMVLKDKGDYEEAEPLYRESLAIRRKLMKDDDPALASSLNNLAALLKDVGKLDEAESMYRESLTIRKKVLGETHPHVARALNNLAEVLVFRGNLEEAEPMIAKALEIQASQVGEQTDQMGYFLLTQAQLFMARKQWPQAEKSIGRSLDILRGVLPLTHWVIPYAESLLGETLAKQDRFDEAEPLLTLKFPMILKIRGPHDKYVREWGDRIQGLYQAWNRPDEYLRFRELIDHASSPETAPTKNDGAHPPK